MKTYIRPGSEVAAAWFDMAREIGWEGREGELFVFLARAHMTIWFSIMGIKGRVWL